MYTLTLFGLVGWPLWLQWWSATLTKFFDFVSFIVSHVKVDFQKVLTASKITGKYTLRKTELIFISIHYWQRYWDEKGIKTLGRTHRIIIFSRDEIGIKTIRMNSRIFTEMKIRIINLNIRIFEVLLICTFSPELRFHTSSFLAKL